MSSLRVSLKVWTLCRASVIKIVYWSLWNMLVGVFFRAGRTIPIIPPFHHPKKETHLWKVCWDQTSRHLSPHLRRKSRKTKLRDLRQGSRDPSRLVGYGWKKNTNLKQVAMWLIMFPHHIFHSKFCPWQYHPSQYVHWDKIRIEGCGCTPSYTLILALQVCLLYQGNHG